MSDSAVTIATIATCISLVSCVMSWNTMRHSTAVWRSFLRLHKEFWRQSLVQANHNSNAWRAQAKNAEHVAFILNHLCITAPPSDKPPDAPLH